jgi:Ca2+:H+ antiporter
VTAGSASGVHDALPRWSVVLPLVSLAALAGLWGRSGVPGWVLAVVAVLLIGSVLAAVIHAETLAHRVGEPMGSLLLAVAVTVIEVGLIVTLMLGGKAGSESVARDTVFAAIMICCNVIAGLSLLIAARRRGLATFRSEGPTSAVAAIATLATLSLVLPSFTTTEPGPEFSPSQLAFAAVASLTVYGLFVLVQNVRNTDLFVSVIVDEEDTGRITDARPGRRRTTVSAIALVVSLVAVVGLAKVETPGLEGIVATLGLPLSFVGLIIAGIVLLPEGISAVRSANRDHLQTSLNLAYGSGLASIGLTIPAVAVASLFIEGDLLLGLGPRELVLLVLTLAVSALSVLPGKATVLQGGLHLVLGAAFVVLTLVP